MKLYIRGVRVRLHTDIGPVGATAVFEKGLNVIRAENTSGKSALMNSILYALGLEVLVGKRGIESMKPVLVSSGRHDGETFNVIESYVELEIENQAGETITVRRFAKGPRDSRLVEVLQGSMLTEAPLENQEPKAYFVGIEGAAQRDDGFHFFLAHFLNLDLPLVKRFQGSDVPLYMECVAPLMFIEQIRGWSGIQATIPQSFGIRNVARVSFEYLLSLDVIENEKKRIEIAEEATRITGKWSEVRESIKQVALRAGGRPINVLTAPTTTLDPNQTILISVEGKEGEQPIDEFLVARREHLRELFQTETSPTDEGQKRQLEEREDQLAMVQSHYLGIKTDIREREHEIEVLRRRLDFIQSDIRRNKDVQRLRQMGVDQDISIVKDRCPTCDQEIPDSLVPTEGTVMTLDENLSFLSSEKDAINLLVKADEDQLEVLSARREQVGRQLDELRRLVRDLRKDMINEKGFSISRVREQLQLQEEIRGLEQCRDEFESDIERLRELSRAWEENRIEHSRMPSDYFSEHDKEILNEVSEQFSKDIDLFGYRSSTTSRLHLSQDNYRPVCDDFEVAFGASASDNIRLIWAYTLALLQVSIRQGGKHWGVILFDEPEQQQMKEASADALYARIAEVDNQNFQVIIATSASPSSTAARLEALPHTLIEFGELVFRPVQE